MDTCAAFASVKAAHGFFKRYFNFAAAIAILGISRHLRRAFYERRVSNELPFAAPNTNWKDADGVDGVCTEPSRMRHSADVFIS